MGNKQHGEAVDAFWCLWLLALTAFLWVVFGWSKKFRERWAESQRVGW